MVWTERFVASKIHIRVALHPLQLVYARTDFSTVAYMYKRNFLSIVTHVTMFVASSA